MIYKLATISLFAICFVLPVRSAEKGENLLKNGDFSRGFDKSGVPRGWKKYGNTSGRSVFRSGDAVVIRDASDSTETGIVQAVPCSAGISLKCEIKARAQKVESAAGSFLQLRFKPSDKLSQVSLEGLSEKGYRTQSLIATAPEGTTEVQVFVYTHKESTSSILLNSVELVKVLGVAERLSLLKDMYLETSLVSDGKAECSIVYPDGLETEAATIAAAVRDASGVELSMFPEKEAARANALGKNLILIGNRNTNRFVSEFYDRYFCLLDLRYPGAGGFNVRTLHNPNGDGRNFILVGGSDRSGTVAAIEKLCEHIEALPKATRLTLPRLCDIKLGEGIAFPKEYESVEIWGASAGYGSVGYFGWNAITKAMALYYMTGDEYYAREFVRLAFPDQNTVAEIDRLCNEQIEVKNDPLAGPYHYNAHLMIVYWDLIEESPFFDDATRLRVTNAFLRQFRYWRDVPRAGRNIFYTAFAKPFVGDRHESFVALSLYTVAKYFQRYYKAADFEMALQAVDNYFAALRNNSWLKGEGGNAYWLNTSLEPVFDWTLISGNRLNIPRVYLQEMLDRLKCISSGDENDWAVTYGALNFFLKAYYLTGDSSCLTLLKLSGVDTDMSRIGQSFWPSQIVTEPLPLDKWTVSRPCPEEARTWSTPFPDRGSAFKHASFRDGGENFLLLDGHFEQGSRNPYHNLSTVRLKLNGGFLLSGYRNQLYPYRDGIVSAHSAMYAQSLTADFLGQTVFFSGTVYDYNWLDWNRSIMLRKNRYAVFVDQVRGDFEQDNYDLDFSWELGRGCKVEKNYAGGAVLCQENPEAFLFRLTAGKAKAESNLSPDNVKSLSGLGIKLLTSKRKGDWLELPFVLEKPLGGELLLKFLCYNDRGLINVYLDGKPLKKEVNCFREEVYSLVLSLGQMKFDAGKHVLKLETAGPAFFGLSQYIGFSELAIAKEDLSKRFAVAFGDAVEPDLQNYGVDPQNEASGTVLTLPWRGMFDKKRPRTFFTVFAETHQGANACIRLDENSALALLPEPALLVKGKADGLTAAFAVSATDHLYAKRILRDELVESTAPVDIDWDFSSGLAEIKTSEETSLTFTCRSSGIIECASGTRKDSTITVPAGTHHIGKLFPDPLVLDRRKKFLTSTYKQVLALRENTLPDDRQRQAIASNSLVPKWTVEAEDFVFAAVPWMKSGEKLCAVASGNKVLIISSDGKQRQTVSHQCRITALHAWNSKGLLLVGGIDNAVVAYGKNGERVWSFNSEMAPEVYETGKFYWYRKSHGHDGVRGLCSGPFVGGKEQAFVGSACTVEILNDDGTLCRRVRQWWGPCDQFAMLHCKNGQNKLLVGRSFNGFHHLGILESQNPKFGVYGFHSTPPGIPGVTGWQGLNRGQIHIEDLDGDGVEEVLSDINGIYNRLTVWDSDGNGLYDVCFGPGPRLRWPSESPRLKSGMMRGMEVSDIDNDGKVEIAVVISRKLLVVFDSRLQKKWSLPLDLDPMLLTCTGLKGKGRPALLAGGMSGELLGVDGKGQIICSGKIEGIPACALNLLGCLLVGTDSGKVYGFDFCQNGK